MILLPVIMISSILFGCYFWRDDLLPSSLSSFFVGNNQNDEDPVW